MLINVNQLFLMLHRLNNLQVTGGDSFGIGVGGGGGKARSQSRSPTRTKVIAKVTQGHVKVTFKVKSKHHSEGHSKSFQGQT